MDVGLPPPARPDGGLRRPVDPRTRDFGLGWESAAALRAVADYGPELVVALDVDFGHTSPQLVLPHGGRVTVDGARQRIIANFG